MNEGQNNLLLDNNLKETRKNRIAANFEEKKNSTHDYEAKTSMNNYRTCRQNVLGGIF